MVWRMRVLRGEGVEERGRDGSSRRKERYRERSLICVDAIVCIEMVVEVGCGKE